VVTPSFSSTLTAASAAVILGMSIPREKIARRIAF
jgi:hypothetical protein